jgi:two-component system response regulator DesR
VSTSNDVAARTGQQTIVLVHPLHTVRSALELLLGSEPAFSAVVAVDRAGAAVAALRSNPGTTAVALVDLSPIDDGTGFGVIREIRAGAPDVILVATSRAVEPEFVSGALLAGADGFVHTGVPPARFLDAVRRALAGEVVLEGLPPGGADEVAVAIRRHHRVRTVLTPRERQVLAAAGDGLTARQIAARLGVRERTVTTHLGHIYRKLKMDGRAAAVAAARSMARVLGPGSLDER